jgi:homoserine O-acetyltransferase/O-succinyltransferase
VPPKPTDPDGATGAWSPGDQPGHRQFARLFEASGLDLEGGGRLGSVEVAYETWGSLNRSADNAVLVLHALTMDSHAGGPAGPGHPRPGWWAPVIGPGAPIDTERFFVVCPNVLGGCQGTTGPASVADDGRRFGSRFPLITIRDQVRVEMALATHLGIQRWAGVVGGSMGGMRALEWCVMSPDRVDHAVVLAVGAAATAEQIGLCALQARAIRADPHFSGGDYYQQATGPHVGMAIARGIGQISYRTATELAIRFGRTHQEAEDPLKGGRYSIESYLEHQGETLSSRFDPNSYIVLSEAMNRHDVGRGRGGAAAALAQVRAAVTVVGISSDRLYPLTLQEELAAMLPAIQELRVVESVVGHDGFLVETEAVGAAVRSGLNLPA